MGSSDDPRESQAGGGTGLPGAGRRGATAGRLFVLAVLCGLSAVAQDPEGRPQIRKITFEGREFLPEEKLLETAGLRPGAPLAEEDIEEALRALVRHPFVASVSSPEVTTNPDGSVNISIRIVEKRSLGDIRFEGNDALRTEALLEASGLEIGQPYDVKAAAEAKEAVLLEYEKGGFLLAQVRPDAREAGAGRIELTFHIREGRRVHVTDVELEGARQIREAEALSYLTLQPRRLFGLVAKGTYLPSGVEGDLEALRRLYESRGFLSARVGFGGLELHPRMRSATARFQVEEGPRWVVESARVEGSKLFPEKLLEKTLALPSGGFYDQEEVDAGLQRLRSWYEGHSDNVPTIKVRRLYGEGAKVTVIYEIKEEELVEVGEVEIRGNRRTRDRVLRREVTFVPGNPFAPTEAGKTLQNLQKQGILKSAEISLTERTDPEKPGTKIEDVVIDVKEQESYGRLLEVGGGASSGFGGVGYLRMHSSNFDLFRLPDAWDDWRNAFLGGGQHLDLTLIPGSKESQYSFRFEEPYFFRSDFSFSLRGRASVLERTTYDESRFLGSAELEKFFDCDRRFSASLSYVAEEVKIHDLDDSAPPDVVEAEGRTFLSYPRLTLRYDDRESNFYSGPTGLIASAGFDLGHSALGSELDFARTGASADYYLHVFDRRPDYRHIVHLSLDARWMEGIGGEGVPLFERFYLGGPPGTPGGLFGSQQAFPGFHYRRLGPHQGSTPVGGEGGIWGIVDYSFPLLFRELRGFGLFAWGDLEPGFSDITTARFRTSAGGGISIRLDLYGQTFPAAFYWVKALSSEEGDREEFFSFTLGFTF